MLGECVLVRVCIFFTVRAINGCKRSLSPKYCTKPRLNKEKGQRIKGSTMAITDFLESTWNFYLLNLSLCAFLCVFFVCLYNTGTGGNLGELEGDLVGRDRDCPVNKRFIPAAS